MFDRNKNSFTYRICDTKTVLDICFKCSGETYEQVCVKLFMNN